MRRLIERCVRANEMRGGAFNLEAGSARLHRAPP
jgi:hypothetical protein